MLELTEQATEAYLPAGHAVQFAQDAELVVAEYVRPAAHAAHTTSAVALHAEALYVPAAQGVELHGWHGA